MLLFHHLLCVFLDPAVSVHCQHATSLELPGTAAFCHLSLPKIYLYTLFKYICIIDLYLNSFAFTYMNIVCY